MTIENKKGYQLAEINPANLEVHELAHINPMMPEDQYTEFKKKFVNGFDKNVSHVVLYKGKVVDGRHRTRACKELGINLWARNLPGTMSTKEVEDFVEQTESRRHQTATQRAIGAFKYYNQRILSGNPVSQEYAAAQKLSNRKNLARAQTLTGLIGTELMDRLHNGEKLKIKNPVTGMQTQTDVLTTLISYFSNRNEEIVVSSHARNELTDAELAFASNKFNELQLECNPLVLRQLANLINNSLRN